MKHTCRKFRDVEHGICEGLEAGEVCIYKHPREDPNIWNKKEQEGNDSTLSQKRRQKIASQGFIGNIQD